MFVFETQMLRNSTRKHELYTCMYNYKPITICTCVDACGPHKYTHTQCYTCEDADRLDEVLHHALPVPTDAWPRFCFLDRAKVIGSVVSWFFLLALDGRPSVIVCKVF